MRQTCLCWAHIIEPIAIGQVRNAKEEDNMKKTLFTISALIVALLCSCCANQQPLPETEEAESASHDVTVSESKIPENWDLYQITDSSPFFSTAMSDNPIDVAYKAEIDSMSTVGEFIEVEKKYIAIWQNEMDASIESFLHALTDEDAKFFMEIQEAWLYAIDAELQATNDLLRRDAYKLQLGQESSQLLLSEKRNIYRERTIKIKYLHYLFETQSFTPVTQLQSTNFYYTGE